jgi:hypothetical protein
MLRTIVSMQPMILYGVLLLGVIGLGILIMRASGKKVLEKVSTGILLIITQLLLLLSVTGLVGQAIVKSIFPPSAPKPWENNAPNTATERLPDRQAPEVG